jgi:hypothetical protein
MPEQDPGRLRLEFCRADGEGFISSRLLRKGVRRATSGFVCAAFLCAAFFCVAAAPPSSSVAAAASAPLVAQAEDQNQPAEASPAAPPPGKPETKPAPKHPRKPAPKPQAAAPAKTAPPPPPPQAQPAPAAAPPGPTAPAAPAPAAPPPPKPPPSTAAEPQPLVHAAQAGVKSCLDGVARAANGTIDTRHAAMSNWFTGAADSHVFESIVSLAYPNAVSPRAVAILLAAPTQPQSCDTSTVQIFPTARPCNVVLADLLKEGKVIADLDGMPVSQSPNGARQILMPTAGNGCVMIVVALTFGK